MPSYSLPLQASAFAASIWAEHDPGIALQLAKQKTEEDEYRRKPFEMF